MTMRAVLFAAFSSGSARPLLGFALGERGRLPLGRTLGIGELFLQIADEHLEFRDAQTKRFVFEPKNFQFAHANLDRRSQLPSIMEVPSPTGK
jgi:hypothetical protein